MKFETKEETEVRHLAWKTYRYFERNKALLNRADNLRLYEKSKAMLIRYFKGDKSDRETAEIIEFLAELQNNYEPDKFVPTPSIAELILCWRYREDL